MATSCVLLCCSDGSVSLIKLIAARVIITALITATVSAPLTHSLVEIHGLAGGETHIFTLYHLCPRHSLIFYSHLLIIICLSSSFAFLPSLSFLIFLPDCMSVGLCVNTSIVEFIAKAIRDSRSRSFLCPFCVLP